MRYIARISKTPYREQTVKEHFFQVSQICAEHMSCVGLEKLGEITGLIHDAGKLSKEFQKYIRQTDQTLREV